MEHLLRAITSGLPERFEVWVPRNGQVNLAGHIRHVTEPERHMVPCCYANGCVGMVWAIKEVHTDLGQHKYGEGWLAEIPGDPDPDHFTDSGTARHDGKVTAILRVIGAFNSQEVGA